MEEFGLIEGAYAGGSAIIAAAVYKLTAWAGRLRAALRFEDDSVN